MKVVDTSSGAFSIRDEGQGPAVLLLHGWPETAHSWRHQFAPLVAAGFRVVAPNQRGYDGSFAPDAIEAYSIFHLVGYAIAILDALKIEKAVAVGHDWGAPVAWTSALMRPDRIAAVVGMSVPYASRGPKPPLEAMREAGAGNHYMLHFQEPGRTEAELERNVSRTMRRILYSVSGSLPDGATWRPFVPEGGGFLDTTFEPDALPQWLSDEDLDIYIAAFERSGFRRPLNWYRNIDRNWELSAALAGLRIRQPSLFVIGARDPLLATMGPAVEALPRILPDLRGRHVIERAGHWVQQEAPEAVNRLLLEFLGGLPGHRG